MSNPVKFALVYQGVIANVFQVGHFHQSPIMRGNVTRIRQATVESCIAFVEGAGAAGAAVRTYHVDNNLDAMKQTWNIGAGELIIQAGRQVVVFMGE